MTTKELIKALRRNARECRVEGVMHVVASLMEEAADKLQAVEDERDRKKAKMFDWRCNRRQKGPR